MGESASNQGNLPAIVAAERTTGAAVAMLLQEPEANTILGPVGGQAGGFGRVEDLDPTLDVADDHPFRFFKELL